MTSERDVIDVSFYGGKSPFGGRETPIEAVQTLCNKYDSCSFFDKGKCLQIRGFNMKGCKHGSNKVIKGYTSRAQKYMAFKKKWQEHERYNKLEQTNKKVGLIDNEVVIVLNYLRITYDDSMSGYLFSNQGMFSTQPVFIPYDDFDSEFIKRIYEARPQALMGGTISQYEKKELTIFSAHLQEVLPDKYKQFIFDYPEYDIPINHVGRKAYLSNLKPCLIEYKDKYGKTDEEWKWDGKYLSLIDKRNKSILMVNVIRKYDIESFIIEPKEDEVIEITNNNQVDSNTVFID